MSTSTRVLSWRDLVIRADPEHVRESRYVVEYEFSAPGRTHGDERTHEGSTRVFRGHYQTRGAYAPETVPDCNLTWRGRPLRWQGQALCWEAGADIPVNDPYLYDDDGISLLTDDNGFPLEVD